jgi:hypothetical protein
MRKEKRVGLISNCDFSMYGFERLIRRINPIRCIMPKYPRRLDIICGLEDGSIKNTKGSGEKRLVFLHFLYFRDLSDSFFIIINYY